MRVICISKVSVLVWLTCSLLDLITLTRHNNGVIVRAASRNFQNLLGDETISWNRGWGMKAVEIKQFFMPRE